jgi:hypothetical protein
MSNQTKNILYQNFDKEQNIDTKISFIDKIKNIIKKIDIKK